MYALWGNLAIFLKDFPNSEGLIRLGRLDLDIEQLRRKGPLRAMISLVGD
ncbi:cyclophilin-like fold protein [Pantoea sp. Tr-811]